MDDINPNKSIMLSRNRPVAFVVGVAGFLGSHLSDELLAKGVQVIGIDDFSYGLKLNLSKSSKDRDFHFVNQSISGSDFSGSLATIFSNLSRLDYAFFVAESPENRQLYSAGLDNFFQLLTNFKTSVDPDWIENKKPNSQNNRPRIVFTSSVELYGNSKEHNLGLLKSAEIKFAKFVKDFGFNGRIIRLAALYGPRMHFRGNDPVTRLFQAKMLGKLEEENTTLSFSTRALFVSDAITLIIKSVLNGSTAQKIYDGCLYQPIRIADLKRIMLDPVWYRNHEFKPEELPPWTTPNLKKAIEELSWRSNPNLFSAIEETIDYFQQNKLEIPELSETIEDNPKISPFVRKDLSEEAKEWLAEEKESFLNRDEKVSKLKEKGQSKARGLFNKTVYLGLMGLIIYSLVFPFIRTTVGAVMIRNNLIGAAVAMENGDFKKALSETSNAKGTVDDIKQSLGWLDVLARIGVLKDQIGYVNQLIVIGGEGIDGAHRAVVGIDDLYQTTKIISGESSADPSERYIDAHLQLQSAMLKISKVRLQLEDKILLSKFPEAIRSRVNDLTERLDYYSSIAHKADTAALIMPQITAVGGSKSYLVLFLNNMELRPAGGFIGSYAKLDFDNGRIKAIKVDDIYNLDGALKEHISPPAEIVSDLGQKDWYLRDSNFEPDFPTSARQAMFFYNKEAGERVHGVIAVDLSASAKLLSAVGGVSLPEYNELVTGNNLFERAITHAETNFFPGSQAKKNYLTSLENQLFNKIFFLTKQNWPGIIQALNESLDQKHIQVYLADPYLFSYVASSNWGGVMPRGASAIEGQTNDFLATVESNMGANKSNYYLERKFKLLTSFGKEGQIFHTLKINYKNSSPSEVFPAGSYKNRLRIYLPAGAKVTKAMFGDNDVTPKMTPFTDYGRSGYSVLLNLASKEEKELVVEYRLEKSLNFKETKVEYRVDVIKQAGTERDPFDFELTYPINFKLVNKSTDTTATSQELNISTNLAVDRSFTATFSNK